MADNTMTNTLGDSAGGCGLDVGAIAGHRCLKPYFHNGISAKCVIASQIDLLFQANKSQTQVMIYLLFVKCLYNKINIENITGSMNDCS
jgi:hypothetical protein